VEIWYIFPPIWHIFSPDLVYFFNKNLATLFLTIVINYFQIIGPVPKGLEDTKAEKLKGSKYEESLKHALRKAF
jgi:hypothetical protein